MSVDPLNLNLDPEAGPIKNLPQVGAALNAWSGTVSDAMNTLEAELHGIAAGVNYIKTAMTGGGPTALDGIDGTNLAGGELAGVFIGSMPANLYFYVLDPTSGAAESVPGVIAPDANPGTKRWILSARLPRVWQGEAAPTVNDDFSTDHVVGDKWIYGGAVYNCVDDTTGAAVWSSGGIGSTPTGTGFRHVTSGTEDAAAKQVENADVATGAAIAEAKLAFAATGGHAHNGVGSTKVDHANLNNPGTNSHAQIDTHLAATAPHSGHVSHALATAASDFLVASGAGAFVKKTLAEVKTLLGFGAASGVATLDSSAKCVQDPANSTATPTASKIPVADGSGKLDGWITPDKGSIKYVKYTIDGGGAVITTGFKETDRFGYAGAILGWTLIAKESGSIALDIWKHASGAIPTAADKITSTTGPSLSSAQAVWDSTSMVGWTTSVAAGDVFGFNVASCATITRVTVYLKIQVS